MSFFTLWMLDFSIPSWCQTVWIQIRSNILLGLIWVQTVCKGYQQTTKFASNGQRVKYKTFVDTTFWLKPWLELIHLAPTFSIRLKCWLQQILSKGKPCMTSFQTFLVIKCRGSVSRKFHVTAVRIRKVRHPCVVVSQILSTKTKSIKLHRILKEDDVKVRS